MMKPVKCFIDNIEKLKFLTKYLYYRDIIPLNIMCAHISISSIFSSYVCVPLFIILAQRKWFLISFYSTHRIIFIIRPRLCLRFLTRAKCVKVINHLSSAKVKQGNFIIRTDKQNFKTYLCALVLG